MKVALWTWLLVATVGCGGSKTDEPVCATGATACNGVCVDLARDQAHCGECGASCQSGVGCFGAVCTSPSLLLGKRYGASAVTLPDGRIMIAGGADGTGGPKQFLDLAEAYDPSINAWTTLDPLPTARTFAGMAVQDGKVLVTAGQSMVGDVPKAYDIVEQYDLASSSWESAPSLDEPRWDAPAVVTSDGRAFVIWGWTLDVPVYTSIEVREPLGVWQKVEAPHDPPRWGVRALPAPDGKIYVLGGLTDEATTIFRSFAVFDPTLDEWTDLPPTNVGHGLGAVALGRDGRVYSMGGLNEAIEAHAEVEVYDPATNAWTAAASLPLAVSDTTAATGSDGRIFVLGGALGLGASPAVDSVQVYDPELDQWFE